MSRRVLVLLLTSAAITCALPASAQVTYETMRALCPPLARICGPTPTPTPTRTPRFTPTSVRPTPSQTPAPATLCPDGMLTTNTSRTNRNWFGFDGVEVRNGQLKRFCAPVMPPQVPDGITPGSLTFTWYDVTDQDCGALSVRIDAVSPPLRPLGAQSFGKSFSASGSLSLYAKAGNKFTPENTAQGLYVITVLGGPTTCNHYDIAWNWQP